MSLDLTYAEIRRELGRFLAIGEDPTAWSSDDVTRVEDIIRRGSRRFYFPEPGVLGDQALVGHNWSFLQQELSVTLAAGTIYYDLPADFIRLTERPTINGSNLPMEEIQESQLRALNNAAVATGNPQYYTIKRSIVAALSYRIGVHPTPTEAKTLSGWYLFRPLDLSASQDPTVPANHSETFLASLLMTADEMLNYETQSEGRHLERFRKLLAASILSDKTIGDENV